MRQTRRLARSVSRACRPTAGELGSARQFRSTHLRPCRAVTAFHSSTRPLACSSSRACGTGTFNGASGAGASIRLGKSTCYGSHSPRRARTLVGLRLPDMALRAWKLAARTDHQLPKVLLPQSEVKTEPQHQERTHRFCSTTRVAANALAPSRPTPGTVAMRRARSFDRYQASKSRSSWRMRS
jgi:hypothetical protein